VCDDKTRLATASGAWISGNHRNDRTLLAWALAVAAGIHLLFFFVHLPRSKPVFVSTREPEPPEIWRPVIPPPPLPECSVAADREVFEPRLPVPFPPAEPPEPIPERAPDVTPESVTADLPFLMDEFEAPPPPPGPLRPGVGNVTYPVLILESKVAPEYPELARTARLEGRVILQAVVHKDGTVSQVEVLNCNRPDLGFEQAAVEAITQWRYEPARQNGVPVDVYFTVIVDFTLR
jgi:protein TonB